MNLMWVQKFEPETMEDLILVPEMKEMFKNFIKNNNVPHLLFAAKPGVGKDSTINILLKELVADTKIINCEINGNMDAVRNVIRPFCEAMSFGKPKIVYLREADRMSVDALNAIRNIIEENADDTRFLLSCNYLNKIPAPIQSRCQHIIPKADTKSILKRVVEILKTEEIEYTQETLKEFIELIIKTKRPDIRAIINILQAWCSSGTLTNVGIIDVEQLGLLCEKILACKTADEMRKMSIANEDAFQNDYEILMSEMFNTLEEPEDMVLCADYIYRASTVVDKSIQAYALFIELKTN